MSPPGVTRTHLTRKVFNHPCGLQQHTHPVDRYICSGIFVKWRRRWRRYLMVTSLHPMTKIKLRSTALLQTEEQRHLRHHYHMIHPFSAFRILWDRIMLLVYLVLLILIPIEILMVKENWPLVIIKLFFDVINWADILLVFYFGYFDHKNQKIVLKQSQVVVRYLVTHFMIDLLSSLPITLYIHISKRFNLFQYKALLFLKIMRMPRISRLLDRFMIGYHLKGEFTKLVSFLGLYVIIILWSSTLFAFVLRMALDWDQEYFERIESMSTFILLRVIVVVRILLLIGSGKIANVYSSVMMLHISFTVLGSVLNMYILAQIIQIYNRRMGAKNKYHSLLQQVSLYMSHKELSPLMKNRVMRFINFKFKNNLHQETEILRTTSSILKQDILQHNCKRLVEKVDIFKNIPTEIMLHILHKLKPEIFLINDVILRAGDVGHSMYFLFLGMVAVYTPRNQEICHLREGSHFGEVALVINEVRTATVVAVKDCYVFRLNRKDFQEALEPYPELINRVRQLAVLRAEKTFALLNKRISVRGYPKI